MKEKTKNNFDYILPIILFFTLGLFLIVGPNFSISLFHIIVYFSFILSGLLLIIKSLIKWKGLKDFSQAICLLIIGIFFSGNRNRLIIIFPILFSVYIILLCLINLSTFIIYKKQNYHGFYNLLITSIINIIFALIILNNPIDSIGILSFILGLYLIYISLNFSIDFFYEYHTRNNKNRRFRWNLPIILTLFMPFFISEKLNKNLTENVTNIQIDHKKLSGDVDLEILIAVKNSNIGKFGHAEIAFDNKIYSYGSYDESSKRFLDMVGDGTIFVVDDKMKYVDFCTKHSEKTFFVFGITLTENQKNKVKKKLNDIMRDTYNWSPPSMKDKNNQYDDYASSLYNATNAQFYKFNNKNKYRLYYAMWNNCVKLVDDVLGATGSDYLVLNGVITPGTYYYFLDNKFKSNNSNVIRKQIIVNGDIFTQKKK